jgi:hypothetical protein
VVAILFLYTRLSDVYKTLKEVVFSKLDEQMKESLIETIQKENSNIGEILESLETLPKMNLYRKLNYFMNANKFPSVDKSLVNEVLNGNLGAVVDIMHRNWGINYNVAVGLAGLLKKDPVVILNSFVKSGTDSWMDPQISFKLGELALFKFLPESPDEVNISTSTITLIKNLMMYRSPRFPTNILDEFFEIVLKGSPRPLKEIWMKLGMKRELINLIGALKDENEGYIQQYIGELVDVLIPKYKQLFYPLQSLSVGDHEGKIKPLSKIFKVKHEFLFQVILGYYKHDWNYLQQSIAKSIKGLTHKSSRKEIAETGEVVTDFLLGLSLLSTGTKIDLVNLVKGPLPNVPSEKVKLLYNASKGDEKSIKFFAENLKWKNPKLVMELSNIITSEEFTMTKIIDRLCLKQEDAPIIAAWIALTLQATKYSKFISENWEEGQDRPVTSQEEYCKISFLNVLERNLLVLRKWNVLILEESGIKEYVKKKFSILIKKEVEDDQVKSSIILLLIF